VVVVYSYGEIDVRCHSSKWIDNPTALALAYIQKVKAHISEIADQLTCVPVILATPPPGDEGHNPKAPFVGSLEERIESTRKLNQALKVLTTNTNDDDDEGGEGKGGVRVLFTGAETWSFAEDANTGGLDPRKSDGHVHVAMNECGPLHDTFRGLLLKNGARGI
jgi:hypothetical protein